MHCKEYSHKQNIAQVLTSPALDFRRHHVIMRMQNVHVPILWIKYTRNTCSAITSRYVSSSNMNRCPSCIYRYCYDRWWFCATKSPLPLQCQSAIADSLCVPIYRYTHGSHVTVIVTIKKGCWYFWLLVRYCECDDFNMGTWWHNGDYRNRGISPILSDGETFKK